MVTHKKERGGKGDKYKCTSLAKIMRWLQIVWPGLFKERTCVSHEGNKAEDFSFIFLCAIYSVHIYIVKLWFLKHFHMVVPNCFYLHSFYDVYHTTFSPYLRISMYLALKACQLL